VDFDNTDVEGLSCCTHYIFSLWC